MSDSEPHSLPAGPCFIPIGIVRSPFPQGFGVPRQASLVPVPARVELDRARVTPESLRGLEHCTHLWLLWWFHANAPQSMGRTVRPPTLGGAERLGVFATRSPHRPNPLGLSAVGLRRVEGLVLHIEGCDLLDKTPVFDIKPYIPAADCFPQAQRPWQPQGLATRTVEFSPAALAELDQVAVDLRPHVAALLALDPRPSYRRNLDDDDRTYAMALGDVDVRFCVRAGVIWAEEIVPR